MTAQADEVAQDLIDMDLEAELNNLAMSKEARPLLKAVKRHIAENVAPIADEFRRLGEARSERWSWAPGQLELLETAKDKAKALLDAYEKNHRAVRPLPAKVIDYAGTQAG